MRACPAGSPVKAHAPWRELRLRTPGLCRAAPDTLKGPLMREIAILLLLGGPVSTAQSTAVSCKLHIRIQSSAGGTVSTDFERDRTAVFVIDDDRQSIREFDPAAVALKNWCADCKLTFGRALISYSSLKATPPDGDKTRYLSYVSTTKFDLNRVSGEYKMSSHTDSMTTSGIVYAQYYDATGICNKTTMPVIAAPTAKF